MFTADEVQAFFKGFAKCGVTFEELNRTLTGAHMHNPHEEDEDDGYFAEVNSEAESTGLEPKFVRLESLETPPADLSSMKVNDLIAMYIAERNQLATDRHGYDARETRIKTHLAVIASVLKDRGDTAGVDSFSTDAGTAFRKEKEQFRVGAWESLVNYIKKTGNFQILQKRLSPNAVKEVKEVDGAWPDGVEYVCIEEFSVRSPTARKSKRVGK